MPEPSLPEFAFVGRSNVGKSSLINLLAGQKQLAKTSSTPGKTLLINLFEVEQQWILVDLPGYGYAKVSQKHRASLETMIKSYVAKRPSLFCTFVLIDASIPLQQIDRDMITWIAEQGLPQAWVFTKVDKGRKRQTQNHMEQTLQTLAEEWEELPPVFETSSEKFVGKSELIQFISTSLENLP